MGLDSEFILKRKATGEWLGDYNIGKEGDFYHLVKSKTNFVDINGAGEVRVSRDIMLEILAHVITCLVENLKRQETGQPPVDLSGSIECKWTNDMHMHLYTLKGLIDTMIMILIYDEEYYYYWSR